MITMMGMGIEMEMETRSLDTRIDVTKVDCLCTNGGLADDPFRGAGKDKCFLPRPWPSLLLGSSV